MSRAQWILIMGLASLFDFCRLAVAFYLPLYFRDTLQFSGVQIGVLFGLASLVSLVTILPIGISNDSIVPRHMVMMGLLFSMVFYGILGFVGAAFFAVLVLFLMREMGQGLFNQSINALIYKTVQSHQKGAFFGTYQFFISIATGLGMIFGGAFLMTYNFNRLFLLIGVILIMLIVMACFLPRVDHAKVALLHYRDEIVRPHILLFITIFFLFALHFGAENTSYGLFLSETLHLSRLHMGYYMATELIFLALSALMLGRSFDQSKISLQSILILGLVASGIGHIGMTYPAVFVSVFFRGIHGIGDGAMFLAMRLGINRLFKIESVGGTSSLVALAMIIGGFVSSLIFGPVGAHWGYSVPLFLSGCVTLFSALLVKEYKHLIH